MAGAAFVTSIPFALYEWLAGDLIWPSGTGWWLIVAIALLLFAVVAGLVASRFAKKVSPPSEAVEEAKRTVETVQTHA